MANSILVIDDSKAARQQVIEILQQTSLFQFYFEAGDGIEGFKMALNQKVDLILCDIEMPGIDGFKFLHMLNSREELQGIPVIMLTGREDQGAKIHGLDQGASDYLTKPFDPAELLARVKVQLKIKSLQDKLKTSNQMLLELSNTDPLTGLYNRRALVDNLQKELGRSKRTGEPLALAMVDIDHFKAINDTHGHQKGDAVLQAVAELLQKQLRQYDLAARFGGEEFALVLPATGLDEGVNVAERLRKAIEKLVIDAPPEKISLTISIGVAAIPRSGIDTLDDLIREADYALYNAKRSGRNRVEKMRD